MLKYKIVDKILMVLGIVVWIETIILGYYFGNSIARIASGIIVISILPIRNLFMLNRKYMKNFIYYILLLFVLIFLFYYSFQNIIKLSKIDLFGEEGYSIYLLSSVLIGYLMLIPTGFLSTLFKKQGKEIIKMSNTFGIVLILVPSVISVLMVWMSSFPGFGPFEPIFAAVLSVLIIFKLFFQNNYIIKTESQKDYFLMFLLSIGSGNFTGILILPILYYQLDKIALNI